MRLDLQGISRGLALALTLATTPAARAEVVAGAGDPVVVSLARLLSVGPGWTLRSGGGELVIERRQPVWVLAQNLINAQASLESEAQREARIKRYGRQIKPRMIYRTERRWSAGRVKAARAQNARLGARLEALGAKHRVAHLLTAALRRKNSDPALGATAAERARLATYRADRARLEARRVRLPDFHTTAWSLFFVRHEGWSDGQHLVHPAAASEECYRLDQLVRDRLLPVEGARP